MRFAYLALAAAFAAIPSIAFAAWSGPGWYVTYSDVSGDNAIYSGPYSDPNQCVADAKALNARVGSDASGAECEHVDKELPSISADELGVQAAPSVGESSPDSAAAAAAGAEDCSWAERICLDIASIKPGTSDPHSIGRLTSYDCGEPDQPSSGKCEREDVEADCVAGIAYGLRSDGTVLKLMTDWDPEKLPLMKKLCPFFEAANAKRQRCLGGRPRLTHEEQLQACTELIAAATDKKEKAKYYSWRAGYYYDVVKQYAAAVTDFSTAIRLDPKADYYDGRSNAYGAQKKFDLAIADLNKSIELEPGKALWIGIRGIMNAHARRYQAALSDYNRALAIDPKNFVFRDQLATVHLKLKRYPEALADAEQIIAASPTLAEGYYYRSVAERALGRGSAADADLAKAREILPRVEEVYGKDIQPDAPPAPAGKASKH